ncbi:hypothetical protein ACFOSD_00815 [Salinispirillum marinum]|uniref:Uncharacterized protein n=2 Tax=Saccharospirillaceae TaxID=255527 RepID=A0ABV8BC12_9GAMM
MSTSAESAMQWLNEQQPSTQTIREMITKLQARIERDDIPEDTVQGSIEALDVLETALLNVGSETTYSATGPTKPAESTKNASIEDIPLDSTPLVSHDHSAPERPPEEKRALFEQLKAQLNRST